MNDTAKPTPGPWVYYNNTHNIALDHQVHAPEQRVARIYAKRGVKSEAQANAALIAEAGTVYHETGLTPRQLLEQRDDAINRLQSVAFANAGLMKQVEALTEQRDELIDLLGQATTMLAFATHTPCTRPPTQFEDEGSQVVEKCRAALAKCGKDV